MLGNAFKFSAKTPAARIEFGCRADGDHAFFVSRQTGPVSNMRFATACFGAFPAAALTERVSRHRRGLAPFSASYGGQQRPHLGPSPSPSRAPRFFFTMWDRGDLAARNRIERLAGLDHAWRRAIRRCCGLAARLLLRIACSRPLLVRCSSAPSGSPTAIAFVAARAPGFAGAGGAGLFRRFEAGVELWQAPRSLPVTNLPVSICLTR